MADETDSGAQSVAETLASVDRGEGGDARDRRVPMVGSALGRYVVLSRLGSGAMGVVYAAYDPELDRRVAIKLLRRERTGASRLQREAQALAKLNHANVVAVHDVGVHEGRVFVAMEYVDGETLTGWLARGSDAGRRSWRDVVGVFEAAGRGLEAAHEQGLVHRDFKPDNVMIGADGRVRVMDFGLARSGGSEVVAGAPARSASSLSAGSDATAGSTASTRTDAVRSSEASDGPDGPAASARQSGPLALDVRLTRTGALLGTPAYMSPEQFLGLDSTPRSDQFAYCVALHEALFGERPFKGSTAAELALSVTEGQLRTDLPADARVPTWLRRVIERGLSTSPDDRFPSMQALLAALAGGEARRRRGARWVGVAALSVAAAASYGAVQWREAEAVSACDRVAEGIHDLWNDPMRVRVTSAIRATEAPHAATTAERLLPWLDAHTRDWRAHRRDVCIRATVEETMSAASEDKAVWCLEEQRLAFGSLVEQLESPDVSVVSKSLEAAASLGPVSPCVDEAVLAGMPAPPGNDLRARVSELRSAVAHAGGLERAGRYAAGLTAALEARTSAEAVGYAPLTAQALGLEARLLSLTGEDEEGERTGIRAFFTAAQANAWAAAAAAAVELTFDVGYMRARPREGVVWAGHAEVAIARAGDPLGLREAGRMNALAVVKQSTGDHAEAERLHEGALAIRERALGPDHPTLVATLNNLGALYTATGEHQRSVTRHRRALEIRERALGPDHPRTANTMVNLGASLANVEEYELAAQYYQRALDIQQGSLGATHDKAGLTMANLALVRQKLGAPDEAATLMRRALEIREKQLGPEHPRLAFSLTGLGEILLELGQHAEAIAHVERALALRTDHEVSDALRAETRFILAQALWSAPADAGRNPARARTLAKRAATEYDSAGAGHAETAAMVRRWLEARLSPPNGSPDEPAPG